MAGENVLEVLDRVEQAINRFERLMYGDPQTRHAGLINEFESLRSDLARVREDVASMQRRRPNALIWISGYATMFFANGFSVIGLINSIDNHNLLDIQAPIAMGLAVGLTMLAMFLLLGGHGWLDGGR